MLGFPFRYLPAIASGKETEKPGKEQVLAATEARTSMEAVISGVSKRAWT